MHCCAAAVLAGSLPVIGTHVTLFMREEHTMQQGVLNFSSVVVRLGYKPVGIINQEENGILPCFETEFQWQPNSVGVEIV